jgi:hypothetical protein
MMEPPSRISGSLLNREKEAFHVDVEDRVIDLLADRFQRASFTAPAFANTISSLPFSLLICAKRRSRSSRFDTSPCYADDVSSNLLYRRSQLRLTAPVMKTNAPSFTNCFAVARPMPLLPPVMSVIFPSSLLMYFSLVVFSLRYSLRKFLPCAVARARVDETRTS